MQPIRSVLKNVKFIVVGSGFYGLTFAERIATQLKKEVLVLEKREHIGGNAFSYLDSQTKIEVHKYGSHLFHTSNELIWNYINQFSKFNNYRHFVISKSGNEQFDMPINLSTLNRIFQSDLDPRGAMAKINSETKKFPSEYENLEQFALSQVGEKVYEKLIKGYTTKQWGKDPKELPKDIFQRLPIRYNYNRDYFSDKFMGLPLDGYYNIFDRMLTSKKIRVLLNFDFNKIKSDIPSDVFVIYSGPADVLFDYKYGNLEWRTLDFEFENLACEDFQGCAVMNYPDLDVPYTRIHEFKHLHPEREAPGVTTIAREFSRLSEFGDEPYYPINTKENREIFKSYSELAAKNKRLVLGGRLGSYKYLDMHMAIGMALKDFDKMREKLK